VPLVVMAVPRSREGIPGKQTKDGTTQTFNNFYATLNRKVQTVKKTAFTNTKATQTPTRVRIRSSSKVYLPTRSKDSEQPVGGHTYGLRAHEQAEAAQPG